MWRDVRMVDLPVSLPDSSILASGAMNFGTAPEIAARAYWRASAEKVAAVFSAVRSCSICSGRSSSPGNSPLRGDSHSADPRAADNCEQ
jgi:hypothetical protein